MNFITRARSLPTDSTSSRLEWEESDCPLCAGKHWTPLVEAADPLPGPDGLWFMVVECRDCGLCYTNPRPSERSIGRFYPKTYVCHQSHAPRRPHRADTRNRDPMVEQLALAGPGRLLDFGCGAGDFLRQMHARGWNVTGLDVSEDVVECVRRDLGLAALAGSLPHPQLADESFDAITMRQALEHVHRPLEVLRAAQRLLAPGGKLLVAVPNIDSLPYRWFGRSWYALDVPRHLTHFAPPTLRAILLRAGFEVESIRMVRHPGWVRHSARLLAERAARPALASRLLGTRLVSGLASWYSYLAHKSDCILAIATRE